MARTNEPYRPSWPTTCELASGAVVVAAGSDPPEVLLLHLKGEDRWCLPKGHVEAGESLAVAAAREVREESGLPAVRLGPELTEVSYRFFSPSQQRNVLKVVVYFFAESPRDGGTLEPLFDRRRWATFDTALGLVPFDTDRSVLRQARDRWPEARTDLSQ